MKLGSVLRSIRHSVWEYVDKRGEYPEKIFLSYELYSKIKLADARVVRPVFSDDDEERLFGIPVKPYHGDGIEYYLAEKGSLEATR